LIDSDRQREFEKTRNAIEYGLAFLKPEAIQKLLRQRENEKEIEENSQVFEQQVLDMFGKPLQSSG